ncbi:MAG TPA: 4-(cytidine 5'-diphospho)-2-C-methyl-D-erythritol kinase [Novosphingobium sp.]|nr:4-(cytidine 5'-diphospho)-2-C-methyl-D-erythritol kinase [Novosphingobium sp.]
MTAAAQTAVLTETAYAKINLALHVRARRADGYHELETFFAFVDAGDVLEARPADADVLELHGEFAALLAGETSNLVTDALALLPHGGAGWHVRLDKRLPVAAGLGGGSADVGAVFRMVARAHGLPDGWPALAARLGADVPACVDSLPVIGRGTGTELAPAATDLAGCPVLLVNPRLPVPTGPVFKAWDRVDRGPMPEGSARAVMLEGRNDLEAPAITICPAVADVLAALRHGGEAWAARMSGSGATCFALYDSDAARDAAAARIAASRPGWWQMAGRLR